MSLTYTLGLTLLHFLWQGAVIALLLAVANTAMRRASARSRYAAACIALALMFACAVTTFLSLNAPQMTSESAAAPLIASAVDTTAIAAPKPQAQSSISSLSGMLPWFVYFWTAGVCILTTRSLGGWIAVRRFARHNARPADAGWQQRLSRLARRLEISRVVRLCESAISEVPAVIGWLRPVVLLPASALSGLSPEQLESLLAHELAHIRRHDYLINLVQTGVETLLFYHPAIWWVSARIRAERENCCDDLAVQVCGDPLVYARALTQLEQLRCGAPRLAMAATSGPLLSRIQRLICSRQPARTGFNGWFPGALLALILIAGWASPRVVHSSVHSGARTTQTPAPISSAATPEASASQEAVRPAQAGSKAHPNEVRPSSDHTDIHLAVDAAPSLHIDAPHIVPASAQEAQPAGAHEGSGFMDEMNKAGYHDLTVDQMIALKIHGVSADYVRRIRAEGYAPTVDQLLAMKIHGVTPEYIAQMKSQEEKPTIDQMIAFRIHGVNKDDRDKMASLGYKLNGDQAIAMRIHGLTPDSVQKIRDAGFGNPTFDQLLALKIHGAGPEYIGGMKQTGLSGLDFDKLIALKIHGADPAQVKEMQSLGFKDYDADHAIAARIFGVTPDYVRETRKRGFKDLTLEQVIKLKQYNLLDRDDSK